MAGYPASRILVESANDLFTSQTQVIAINVQPHLLFSASDIVQRCLLKIDQDIVQQLLLEPRYMYAVSPAWKSSSYNYPVVRIPIFYMSIQLLGVSLNVQPKYGLMLRDNLKPRLCNIEHIGPGPCGCECGTLETAPAIFRSAVGVSPGKTVSRPILGMINIAQTW
jgi:hypothetical protein